MKEKTLTEELVLEDFQRAVVFLTLHKMKKSFKTASVYAQAEYTEKALKLHVDSKFILKMTKLGNKRLFTEFLSKSDHLFTYHKHVAWKYKSGRRFKVNSWFELKLGIDELDSMMNSKLYMDLKSSLYSKRVHKVLDTLFYGKRRTESKKEDTTMTKAEEKEIYDMAAAGKTGSDPKYLIKQKKKKEKAEAKRQQTMINKAIDASVIKLKEQEDEIASLKAEIARLKQLKDLSSDIPSESLESSELEKLRAEAAMWRKIDSDPLACEQHYNEMLSRMLPPQEESPTQADEIADDIDISSLMQLAPSHPDDDIPSEEPPHPSKVLPKLAEHVKNCIVGPVIAEKVSALYGEVQKFKQPVVQCDLTASLQKNARKRSEVLEAVKEELRGQLSEKESKWLEEQIGLAKNAAKCT